MKKDIQISIIGGGIGGLTMALCLEYFGFKNYIVYEQASEFREVGAAISLWPNALRVYKKIGLYDAIKQHWGELGTAYIKTAKGKTLTKATPKYELPAICIHRGHLHQVLMDALPQEKLLTNHKLKCFEIRERTTLLEFENGTNIETQILIGADGIKSNVRKQIINDGDPIYRGHNIWRGIATLENIPLGYASETWGKGARVGIVPIKDNKFGWWATLNEDKNQSDEPRGTLNKLIDIFGNWHEPIPQLFKNSPEIIKTAVGDRIPTKGWSEKNVVLIGDAAHPTTPNLGQGACMAIEGAYLLSNCMAHFNNTEDAFIKYEALHFPRTSAIINQSLQNGKMGQMDKRFAINTRNSIMKAMPEKFALRILDKFFGYDVTKRLEE